MGKETDQFNKAKGENIMTSKERVRRAIEHKSVDRVPTDFSATPLVLERLREEFKVDKNEGIYEALDIDIRPLSLPFLGAEAEKEEITEKSYKQKGYFGETRTFSWNGKEYHGVVTEFPLGNATTVEDVEKHSWPDTDLWDFKSIPASLDKLKDKAVIIGHWGPFQTAGYLYPDEKLYMDMALNKDFAHAIFRKHNEFQLTLYRKILEAGEGRIDILRTHDDYGTQRNMLFSQDMWCEFFAENTKKLVDLAHEYGAFFMQHSCGAIRKIIPELIKVGVDALDPVQPVIGMDPESLKDEFSGKICFHGGIDTQDLLPNGSPNDIKKEVRRYIDLLNNDGGYILSPSQAFESDIPLENIKALYEIRS